MREVAGAGETFYAAGVIEVSDGLFVEFKRKRVYLGPFNSLDLARAQLRTLVHTFSWANGLAVSTGRKIKNERPPQHHVLVGGSYLPAKFSFVMAKEPVGECEKLAPGLLSTPVLLSPTVMDLNRPGRYATILQHVADLLEITVVNTERAQ